ncbi:MAG: LmbE family protein [Parcubacteria group bacterium Gr01-1014_70]|nr:MAG: LmbE family protein [Parcubacteria group bacterium Gr01-1014_70]
MRILILTAHPDDMECTVGGFLFKLCRAGHEVHTIIATSGRKEKQWNGRSHVEVREEESKLAHNMIGATPHFLQTQYPNLCLETGSLFDTRETRELVCYLVNSEFNPDAVFTFWPVDVHPDHRMISTLTMNACLQKGMNREIFCFEAWAGTSEPYPQSLCFRPTHYVDITDVLAQKKMMVFCHQSQNPQGLWDSDLKLAEKRGYAYECNIEFDPEVQIYAEAFIRLTREGGLCHELEEFLKA